MPVEYACYEGVIHGFQLWGAGLDATADLMEQCAAALKRAFATA